MENLENRGLLKAVWAIRQEVDLALVGFADGRDLVLLLGRPNDSFEVCLSSPADWELLLPENVAHELFEALLFEFGVTTLVAKESDRRMGWLHVYLDLGHVSGSVLQIDMVYPAMSEKMYHPMSITARLHRRPPGLNKIEDFLTVAADSCSSLMRIRFVSYRTNKTMNKRKEELFYDHLLMIACQGNVGTSSASSLCSLPSDLLKLVSALGRQEDDIHPSVSVRELRLETCSGRYEWRCFYI